MISGRKWNNLILYLIIFIVTLPIGCSPLRQPPKKTKPFLQEDASQLVFSLREQNKEIDSFQGIGKIIFEGEEGELESNLFIVGKRPFKTRIEITHIWGKPLFHIVINGRDISVLSLMEKKFFRGHGGSLNIDQLFLLDLDPQSIWDILAGRAPVLDEAERAVRFEPNEVVLLNSNSEAIEIIRFSSNPVLPKSVYFPMKEITITLSKFRKMTFGYSPLQIEIIQEKRNRLVKIEYKNFEVNRPVPDEIFALKPLPGFKIIELDKPVKVP